MTDSARWRAQPAAALETLAQAWSIVDFFAEAPPHLQGSLLLALTRRKALLVGFTDGRSLLLIHFDDAAAVWRATSTWSPAWTSSARYCPA